MRVCDYRKGENVEEMEESQMTKIGETPHGTVNKSNRSSRSSYDSVDSGYLTLTPHSGGYTPIVAGGRTRSSRSSAKRYHRMRTEPWQSDRAARVRSKFNHMLNSSETPGDSLFASETREESLCSEHPSALSSGYQSLNHGDRSLSTDYKVFRSELRELRSRTRMNNSTAVAVTPASSLPGLVSPEIPSSSFTASEPIEEDVEMVEMKLVIVPQSTPQVKMNSPAEGLVSSPTSSKASPRITSADNQKLSKLMITDLVAKDIKPKRLDFSQRALSVALQMSRATPDYTGKDTVDLLALLGEKSNHWRIVSRILALLGPQDLCSITMVSKAWRRICANDSRANMRRLSHMLVRQNAKENLKLIRKAKMEGDVQTSPKSRYARKGYLLEVQNLLQVPPNPPPPNSPPVSPSKVKFHSFVKEGRTLEPWEHLLRCPRCSFACHVDDEKNVATCSRQGCSFEFCSSCASRPHTGPCKTPLLATPTKRNKRLIVGSRQSKRNLRRL